MPLRVQEGEDSKEISPTEKMFPCNLKISRSTAASVTASALSQVQHSEIVPELPGHVEDPLPAWRDLPKLCGEQVADAAVLLPRDLQIAHKHLLSGRKLL